MRRGCMSLGEVKCDICQRTIPYPERYLVVNEEGGVEVEKGKAVHYCVECALKKGYAHYKEDKGERILTFFPEPDIASE
jgi:hypothetical protein